MKIVLSNQAKFDPYTFDELLKVPAMYTAEYNAIEDQYNDTLSKLQAYKKYADENPDSDWAKEYSKYVKLGESAVEDMATNRLSAKSRSELKKYLRDYNAITVPIEEGIKTYKEQEAVRLANPNRLYKKALTLNDAMNGSIDNSFTTEEDVAKETLAEYSPKFTLSYVKYIDEGKTPEEAAELASNENASILTTIKGRYNELGYTKDSDRIEKAVNYGASSAMIKAAENELLTRAQRIANKQAERAYIDQQNAMHREYALRGVMIDPKDPTKLITSTDPNNVYWRSKGFTLDKETGKWIKEITASKDEKEAANRQYRANNIIISDGIVRIDNSTKQNLGTPMTVSFNSLTGKYEVKVSGQNQAFMTIDPESGIITTESDRGVDVGDDDIMKTLKALGTQLYNYNTSDINVRNSIDLYINGSNVAIQRRDTYISPSSSSGENTEGNETVNENV